MTDPGDPHVVALEGAAGDLLAAIMRLEGYDFALVGGLAVMVRLGGAHRVTNDLDGVFDNPTRTPPPRSSSPASPSRRAFPTALSSTAPSST